jgi:hypothetical protein
MLGGRGDRRGGVWGRNGWSVTNAIAGFVGCCATASRGQGPPTGARASVIGAHVWRSHRGHGGVNGVPAKRPGPGRCGLGERTLRCKRQVGWLRAGSRDRVAGDAHCWEEYGEEVRGLGCCRGRVKSAVARWDDQRGVFTAWVKA